MTAVLLADRVLVSTTTTGTGTYSLGSAVTGYLDPAGAGLSAGVRVAYVVVDSLTAPTAFEIGEGVYTSGSPGTLTRAQIRRNTSGGTSAVNWGAGTKYIFLAPNAANLVVYDSSGALALAADLSVGGNLAVTGNAAVTGTMNVSGNATFNAAVTATGNLSSSANVSDGKGNVRAVPQNSQSSGYSLVATDAGKHVAISTGGITIPAGVFAAGDAVTIYNNSGATQNINAGIGTTVRQAATANTGNRTLAQYGLATVLCTGANAFVVTGAGVG